MKYFEILQLLVKSYHQLSAYFSRKLFIEFTLYVNTYSWQASNWKAKCCPVFTKVFKGSSFSEPIYLDCKWNYYIILSANFPLLSFESAFEICIEIESDVSTAQTMIAYCTKALHE